MKWLLLPLLALVLAGCADAGNFDREKPIKEAAPMGHILSATKQVAHHSLRARAKLSKADGIKSTNNLSLMECVSDACKVKCAPGIEKQSRPKWCMYFREPIGRHAQGATPDTQRKTTQ